MIARAQPELRINGAGRPPRLNEEAMHKAGDITRRRLMQSVGAALASAAAATKARADQTATQTNAIEAVPYSPAVLPAGIRSRFVNNINGIRMHVLEAGFEVSNRPAVLMLHGFPRLAYSWNMLGTHLVDGAGHWVQQEQPEAVSKLLVQFLQTGARA